METHTAYISVGSNIGDKLSNCQKGIAELTRSDRSRLMAQSQFYSTEPVDYEDQDWFVNAAVKIETRLNPFELLKTLKSIEREAGRTAESIRFGPRILDLDLILYDDLVINTAELVVPHPRMHKRRFVLQPICDIDPAIVHPIIKKRLRDLLESLDDCGQRIFQYKCDY